MAFLLCLPAPLQSTVILLCTFCKSVGSVAQSYTALSKYKTLCPIAAPV